MVAGAIVVGTDGSEAAERAVQWAGAEAVLRERPLHIVHAVEKWPYTAPLFAGTGKADYLTRTGEALLKRERDRVRERWPELTTTTVLVPDETVAALKNQSDGAFEIVVGGRGRGGFAGMLLGSTSQRMAAHSDVPVVIVRGEGGHGEGNEIVVGVDLAWESGRVLEYAFEAAALHGVPLRAVHAWSAYGMPIETSIVLNEDAVHQELVERVTTAHEPLRSRYPDVEVETDVVMEHPVTALAAASRGARLLVVGVHHRHWDALRLGSVSHGAVHYAGCPVAVVPPR